MSDKVVLLDKNGNRVDPGLLHTDHSVWQVIDASASASGGTTDLLVTERTYQGVLTLIAAAANGHEEISIFDIPRGWNAIRLREICITNDVACVYKIYLGTLGDNNTHAATNTTMDCELAYVGLFTFTTGTQASTTSTYEFADTLVVTEDAWAKTITVASPTGNRIAEATFDLMGADVLVAVSETVAADCKLLGKGY